MFSEWASHFQGQTNPLYRERNALLARGEEVHDLISGNVHQHGLFYPQSILENALLEGAKQAKVYRPDPLGQWIARESIYHYYKEEGLSVPPDQILLTPGTSISYWYAFKLLADVGDEILCPQPTYPLFDSIAALSGIRLHYYRLREWERWTIDLDHLESNITQKTRAIVLISPHNPTGAVASEAEIEEVATIAARYHLPIISDEVFSPFLFRRERLPRPAATHAPLVFTLNGFSKMFALPGIKIGWMALSGEATEVKRAIGMLETFSDTFLPVNDVSQFAVPLLFREGRRFLAKYRSEIQRRCEIAIRTLSGAPHLSFIPPEGGFYLTVRMTDLKVDEEKVALDLLRQSALLIHPGFFYDLEPSHFVISFVSEPPLLRECLEKIIHFFSRYYPDSPIG